jgi:hypothetical protein
MEGYCSTGQSPQRAVVTVEEEEEEEEEELCNNLALFTKLYRMHGQHNIKFDLLCPVFCSCIVAQI